MTNVLNTLLKHNRYITNNNDIKTKKNNNKKQIAAASIAGSALGIAGAVAGVYSMAKKGNPSLAFKNLNYAEKDVLLIGAGSVIGGLTGGLIADKNNENIKPKLREASQQFFGNMACPIGLLALSNHILDKTNFQLPKLNVSNPAAKILNPILGVLPKVVMTIGSLIGGMEMGNKVMNKVNDKVFNEKIKHKVEAEDYLVHADDLCLTANMLLKDAPQVSKITSKILPFTFIVAGSKTGMQQKEDHGHHKH